MMKKIDNKDKATDDFLACYAYNPNYGKGFKGKFNHGYRTIKGITLNQKHLLFLSLQIQITNLPCLKFLDLWTLIKAAKFVINMVI